MVALARIVCSVMLPANWENLRTGLGGRALPPYFVVPSIVSPRLAPAVEKRAELSDPRNQKSINSH